MINERSKSQWAKVLGFVKDKFSDGEEPDLDTILFLIGVRELGVPRRKFKKDEKIQLLHIAICRVLQPYGYYELEGLDADGWPHYKLNEKIPNLKAGEQSILMKEAVIRYFEDEDILPTERSQ